MVEPTLQVTQIIQLIIILKIEMLTNIQVYLEDNEFNSLINNFYTSSEV